MHSKSTEEGREERWLDSKAGNLATHWPRALVPNSLHLLDSILFCKRKTIITFWYLIINIIGCSLCCVGNSFLLLPWRNKRKKNKQRKVKDLLLQEGVGQRSIFSLF